MTRLPTFTSLFLSRTRVYIISTYPLFPCYFVFLRNQLVHLSTRLTCPPVPLLLCLPPQLTCSPVHSFTCPLVPLLPCLSLQSTCLLVHPFTCPLPPRVYYLRNILPFSLLICFFLLTLPTLIKEVRYAC